MSSGGHRRRLLFGVLAALCLGAMGTARAGEPDLAELRLRAEAGDPGSQNDLGSRLVASEDETQFAEARAWFRRAADAGDVEALNNYATMLLTGLGGPADEEEGRRLREEAAARGSAGANLSIAEHYLTGAEGYERDPEQALRHVRAAANSPFGGAAYAQWRLAMMHLWGLGTPVDVDEAYRLMVRASDNGEVNAMVSRAVMLATAEGVSKNEEAARHWYRRAAESGQSGFEHGLRGLGAMLVTGDGGPADVPRGIAYLRIASMAGDSNAGILLETWQDRVTPEVDAEARRIAVQWIEDHLPAD